MRSRKAIVIVAAAATFWLALFALIRSGVRVYRVPSTAMTPTIASGDYVVTQRTSKPARWDLIAFRYERDRRIVFLYRVAALPGETVEVRAKKLYVDGREMRDPYAVHEDARVYPNNPSLPEPYRSRDQFGPLHLQGNEFFVLGDNRDHAFDSRYHGAVARQDVVGKVVLVASLENGVWRPSAAPPTSTP